MSAAISARTAPNAKTSGFCHEQKKEQEQMGRLEVLNFKNNDEFRGMLNNLQNDYQTKLEVKITDLVNRLLHE